MGKDISHLIIWGNEDENDNSKNTIGALEILEHFWEKGKEKERWIIIIWAHDFGLHTAHLLADALSHHPIIFAQTNQLWELVLSDVMLEKKPEHTMEHLIEQISLDLEKRMTVMRDDIDSYKLLQDSDIAHKKEQEKLRRKHMNKKKISGRK